ncbi:hypothetical protein [Synechococcus sp. H70.2]|uniref:hypothetical protein n=1 Tax=unclassified Synechococcus TaxID=2626047 RepID=UPI0039C34B12
MVSLQALVQSIPKTRRGIPEVIWIQATRDLAQGRFWPSLLTTIGCLSNIAYTCTLPFVTVGIVTGTTLTRQRAIVSASMIWLANQIFGYTWHNYPRTPDSLAWGLVLGIGTVGVAWLASYRPLFFQPHPVQPRQWLRNYLWILVMLILGFLAFEGLILAAGLVLGGTEGLTLPILGKIWLHNWLWTGFWLGIHALLTWDRGRRRLELARAYLSGLGYPQGRSRPE